MLVEITKGCWCAPGRTDSGHREGRTWRSGCHLYVEDTWVLATEQTWLAMNPNSAPLGASQLKIILGTWKALWESEEAKPHEKQFHMLALNLTGRLGGWRTRRQPRMSSSLLGSSALPLGHPNWSQHPRLGGVGISSSQELAEFRPVTKQCHCPVTETLILFQHPLSVLVVGLVGLFWFHVTETQLT